MNEEGTQGLGRSGGSSRAGALPIACPGRDAVAAPPISGRPEEQAGADRVGAKAVNQGRPGLLKLVQVVFSIVKGCSLAPSRLGRACPGGEIAYSAAKWTPRRRM